MLDQVCDIIKENNVKLTPHRKEILQVLSDNIGNHLDIVSIYKITNSIKHNMIGVATIYRTLELFENIGLVSRITMDGASARYELTLHNGPEHHHLICLQCGSVQDIKEETVSEFKARIDRALEFEIKSKPMKIYGYCRECRNNA